MKFNLDSVKVFVLTSLTFLMFLVIIFSNAVSTTTIASIGGAPAGRTGAPGESTCTSCHNQNTGVGHVNIIAPATYVPGQTYAVQVQNTTTDGSRAAWGFELTSLTSANTVAGTFTNITGVTRTRTGNGRNYIEQSSTGIFSGQTLGSSWTFNWTAPTTDVGPVTFYAAGLHANDDSGDGGDQTYTTNAVSQPATTVVIHHGFSDFDGDGKADASVFRPSDGVWYINKTTGMTGVQWGLATDKLTPADFDGDDKADVAVWREGAATVAAFYILQSSTNTMSFEPFGQTGDDPIAIGDWDGDGKADPAVYRDSAVGTQSYFYYRGSLNNPARNATYLPFGTTGDRAMRGDFDGDGKSDLAVFRPSNSVWYISPSSTGIVRYEAWGLATDKFVPSDYDGDSKTDIAVFRSGVWYIKQSTTGQATFINWGVDTDVLVPADYDGDGKTDTAIYRSGNWWIRQNNSGSQNFQVFGLVTDRPVPGSFVR